MFRRLVGTLIAGVVLLHALPACVGGSDETSLNPQPLPPEDPTKGGEGSPPPSATPGDSNGDVGNGAADGGAAADADASGDSGDANGDP